MNERIRELQSKSYLMCKQIVDDDGHVVVTPDLWFDTFAELILLDCINEFEDVKVADHAHDKYDAGYDDGLQQAIEVIRERFGVE